MFRVQGLVSGGHGGGDTPGSMPNPEVKPSSADGTAGGTRGRVGHCQKPNIERGPGEKSPGPLFSSLFPAEFRPDGTLRSQETPGTSPAPSGNAPPPDASFPYENTGAFSEPQWCGTGPVLWVFRYELFPRRGVPVRVSAFGFLRRSSREGLPVMPRRGWMRG